MPPLLTAIVTWWGTRKHAFETAIPMDAVFLHIAAGMLLYDVGTRLVRGKLGPIVGWTMAAVAIVANEAADLLFEIWPNRGDQVIESVKDIAWTLALPTLALVLSRPLQPLRTPVTERT